MADIKDTLKKLAEQIRDERNAGANTALRVGSLLLAMIEVLSDQTEADEKYLRKDQADETEHLLGLNAGFTLSKEKKIIENLIRETERYIENAEDESVNEGKIPPSDKTFFTSLATIKAIKDNILRLNDCFLRKDIEDTAHKRITFEDGITVFELAKMMQLEVEELATIARAVVPILSSPKFVDGFAGEGYQIWKAAASGDWNFTIDRLTVRKVMTVYELIIQKIRSVGGMICVSAGNGKIKTVTDLGAETEIEFEDINTFVEHDLMRCQTWTGNNIKYYWVEVNRVQDGKVYVLNSEFEGVPPEEGDECVLMGNTDNKLRQSLIMISATEDGQPRIDVLDGIHEKNFNGCLRARLGNLDGISDDLFPADMQPKGNGIYSDNAYLRGVFVLMNGRDVLTQFAILEGIFKSEIASVRREVGQANNILANSTFTESTDKWECGNGVRLFSLEGKFIWFNQNLYSDKYNQATIESYQSRWALRINNSTVKQLNSDYYQHPTFDKAVDKEFNELPYYKTKRFYLSFWYKVDIPGTLTVEFVNPAATPPFEEFTRFSISKELAANDTFELMELSGQWDGKGDIVLSFSGDMYLYNMALSSNSIDDLADRFSTRIEQTEYKISLVAEESHNNGEVITELSGRLDVTAKEIRAELKESAENVETTLRNEYTSSIAQTAKDLTVKYDAEVSNLAGSIEKNTTLITTTAKEIRAELKESADGVTTRLGKVETTAAGTEEKYTNFVTKTYAEYVRTNDAAISTINDTVKGHSTSIKQNTDSIALKVNASGVISAINLSEEKITISSSKINITGAVTFNSFEQALKDKINGKVDSSTIISGNYIKTALIDTESLVVKHISGGTGDFTGDVTATSGKVGGMKISGNSLTNEGFNNDAYIVLRNDNNRTFAGIGGSILPATLGGVQAVARFENGRSIADVDNIAMYCYANGATGTGKNYAIWVARGKCWMPGVLFAGTVQWPSTDAEIQITAKYNFEFLSSVSATGSPQYGYIQINHNLGNTNYVVLTTPAGPNTVFASVANKTSTSFRIYIYGRDGSYQWNLPVSFAVIGLNYK